MTKCALIFALAVAVISVQVTKYKYHHEPHSPTLLVRNEDAVDNSHVLVLTIVKDANSWGKNRTFLDHLNIIESLGYPLSSLSLGFLVSNEYEFRRVQDVLTSAEFAQKGFRRIVLIKKDFPLHINRAERHAARLQRARRSLIARARNTLLFSASGDEQFILWIDADIIRIPSGILQKMVESGHDIITPRCRIGDDEDYDQNAWQGPRIKPTAEQEQAISRGRIFVPNQVKGITKHLSDFHREDPNMEKEFVKLDSVGGTVLFVKSAIHKQGVIFPTDYIVGTTWDRTGYDGVETEGLCYLAKTIGASCWGMPHIVVEHDAS
eukprot:Phypoly_transcript_13791.p1 GENE.Phypoly_transcript_13791~~Phypoly_transcript_13791.p1  ORF type:complete len:332 (+),score=35.19 Phypoly_transcript_13791:33-998(+)